METFLHYLIQGTFCKLVSFHFILLILQINNEMGDYPPCVALMMSTSSFCFKN